MSRAPDDVDALLLRIRTMKWQTVTVVGSSGDRLARENAAALIATLDGMAAELASGSTPDGVRAVRERIEAIALLRDHAPMRRGSGA